MAISALRCGVDPFRQSRDVMIVGQESKIIPVRRFYPPKQGAGLTKVNTILGRLRKDAYESQFSNRAGCKLPKLETPRLTPDHETDVERPRMPAGHLRRGDRSWKIREHGANLLAGEYRGIRAGVKDRQTADFIDDDLRFERPVFSRRENDSARADLSIQRIARPQP